MDKKSRGLINHKIKKCSELKKILGKKNERNFKVIMCHGTFDIVHPGHIRHLLYAKSKADKLIVSITTDKFITKDKMRPFVPEEMRAFNLAALQMVDYVLIDYDPTPLKNIQILEPDYYAKGFEYGKDSPPPKTQEEINILKKFGGEVIFTPGDIVYSSSKIISDQKPNIALEKMLFLMDAEDISFLDLKNSLNLIKNIKVHVVGDTIVDSYTKCSMIGGMTKTPTMSVKFENKLDFLGGAGIVAKHLESAGAKVTFTSLVGNDDYAEFVKKDLQKTRIKLNLIIDKNRPTTNKNAVVVDDYRLLKIDTLENNIISQEIISKFSELINKTKSEIVVFSDFRHGIFNKSTIPIFSKNIPSDSFRVADSQVASRWGNILEFKNFDLITPNEREARFSLGDQDSVIRPLAKQLRDQSKCKTLILKCGSNGLITYVNDSATDPRAFFNLDSMVDNLIDPVGAGDALLAYSSLILKATKNPIISAIIGNIAAAIECEHDGNYPVSSSLIENKLTNLESKSKFI